jgi:predicted  nucleic acid-binding Zn-ribbon protein
MEKENWLDALNDDLRDVRSLTIAVRKETEAIREETKVLREEVKESKRKSDAAWELVIMTREQIKEEIAYLKKPIWKKWFGMN